MWDGSYGRTRDSQFVKIKGSNGETEQYRCNANFDVLNQDVLCVFQSPVNIGDYRCISLRTGGTDGIYFIKVVDEKIYMLAHVLPYEALRLLLNHSPVSSHVISLLQPLCPDFRSKP